MARAMDGISARFKHLQHLSKKPRGFSKEAARLLIAKSQGIASP